MIFTNHLEKKLYNGILLLITSALLIFPTYAFFDEKYVLELWDSSGFAAHVNYSEKCKSEGLLKCTIELAPNPVGTKSFLDDYPLLGTISQTKEIVRIKFTDISDTGESMASYNIHIEHGNTQSVYKVNLDQRDHPAELKEHPELFALFLALQPPLLTHFNTFLTAYYLFNQLPESLILPSPDLYIEKLQLEGQKRSELILKLTDYHSLGFRFHDDSLKRIVLHDCKGKARRYKESAVHGGTGTILGTLIFGPLFGGLGIAAGGIGLGGTFAVSGAARNSALASSVKKNPWVDFAEELIFRYGENLLFEDPENYRTKILPLLRDE